MRNFLWKIFHSFAVNDEEREKYGIACKVRGNLIFAFREWQTLAGEHEHDETKVL